MVKLPPSRFQREEETISLQKLLQSAGFDSRRNIRHLIAEGFLKVNSKVTRNPSLLVNPHRDIIHVKNKRLRLKKEKRSYFLFHKPDGVVSTLSDPQGRPTIVDFTGTIKERVFPVGRLDFHSEGLLLLTNDGDLANFILSPKNKIPKTYLLKVKGELKPQLETKLERQGIFIGSRRVKPIKIDRIKKTRGGHHWIRVTIFEGRKHILRDIFKYCGHPVEKLKRIAIGPFKLKKLPRGHWRELRHKEIREFKEKYAFRPSA